MVIIMMSAHTNLEKIGLKHGYFIFGAQRLWKEESKAFIKQPICCISK